MGGVVSGSLFCPAFSASESGRIIFKQIYIKGILQGFTGCMDKTMEVVVVAMIALASGVILLFMTQGQSDSFEGFLEGQNQQANCNVIKSQARLACPNKAQVENKLGEASQACNLPTSCSAFCDVDGSCNQPDSNDAGNGGGGGESADASG
jgi:hypothetical protein